MRALWSGLIATALGVACGDNLDNEDRQGGDTTIDTRDENSYRQPAANLTADERFRYQAGRSPFDFIWEPPKLGPLFNNIACINCHGGNGRGTADVNIGDILVSQALVRVSLTEGEPAAPGGPVPVPGVGLQLQDHATVGLPEARVTVEWIEIADQYGDGEPVMLREPRVTVRRPDGTMLPPGTRYSFRIGPPLIGLGLLEAIPESALRAHEDPDDRDGDGISGRLNQVWDPETQATVPGRFGWKANTSTLHLQVAAAFNDDIGLSNLVFPAESGPPDISDDQYEDSVFFTSTIAVPPAATRSDEAHWGRALFRQMGCASCHVTTFETGEHRIPALAYQRIHPYTDLLLHDMGDRLTDARRDFLAEGTEWRTPALWGIGLAQLVLPDATFLHDGRARTLAEAILWHGGEAEAAREAFRTAPRAARDALLAFLQTL